MIRVPLDTKLLIDGHTWRVVQIRRTVCGWSYTLTDDRGETMVPSPDQIADAVSRLVNAETEALMKFAKVRVDVDVQTVSIGLHVVGTAAEGDAEARHVAHRIAWSRFLETPR